MKTLYIVDYWMPFPSSEYGGVTIVIAETDEEAVRYLAEEVGSYYKQQYPNWHGMIERTVMDAKRYDIETDESGIVYDFTT